MICKSWYYILLYTHFWDGFRNNICVICIRKICKRGFLYGPVCPIYGFGAVLIILTLKNLKVKNKRIFISMIVFSVFEYVVSWLFEMIFHLRWWDYSNDIGNINGRISIAYSVAWGVIGLVFNEKYIRL